MNKTVTKWRKRRLRDVKDWLSNETCEQKANQCGRDTRR